MLPTLKKLLLVSDLERSSKVIAIAGLALPSLVAVLAELHGDRVRRRGDIPLLCQLPPALRRPHAQRRARAVLARPQPLRDHGQPHPGLLHRGPSTGTPSRTWPGRDPYTPKAIRNDMAEHGVDNLAMALLAFSDLKGELSSKDPSDAIRYSESHKKAKRKPKESQKKAMWRQRGYVLLPARPPPGRQGHRLAGHRVRRAPDHRGRRVVARVDARPRHGRRHRAECYSMCHDREALHDHPLARPDHDQDRPQLLHGSHSHRRRMLRELQTAVPCLPGRARRRPRLPVRERPHHLRRLQGQQDHRGLPRRQVRLRPARQEEPADGDAAGRQHHQPGVPMQARQVRLRVPRLPEPAARAPAGVRFKDGAMPERDLQEGGQGRRDEPGRSGGQAVRAAVRQVPRTARPTTPGSRSSADRRAAADFAVVIEVCANGFLFRADCKVQPVDKERGRRSWRRWAASS
ncbi:unnamed protein product [Sphagnum tenellum]